MSQTARTTTPWLSVVVPAYNESHRIRTPLAAIHDYLRAQHYPAEIVVVDDGSVDDTFTVVRDAASGWTVPVRVFRYSVNAGKGHALKYGIARAAGERILFTDADLSTPIEEAGRLLERIDAGADVVIGSRRMAGARVSVPQPWWRERLGQVFTWLVRRLIADVSDATCGFKAFRREAATDLFARVRVYDWSFDAEVLFLAGLRGYRLEEVPVQWADRAGTKVRVLRDTTRALLGLARIRRNAALGLYRRPVTATTAGEVWESSNPLPAGKLSPGPP